MEHTLFVHQDIALGQSMDLILNEISEENYWIDFLVWYFGNSQLYWHMLYTWWYCLPIWNTMSFCLLEVLFEKFMEVNILLLTFGWFVLNYLCNYRNFLHSQFPLSGHLRLWHSKNYLLMQYKFEQEWLQ